MLSDGYAHPLARERPDDDSAVVEGISHCQRVGSRGEPHEVSVGVGDAPSLLTQASRERVAALGDLGDALEQLGARVKASEGSGMAVLRAASSTRG